MAAAEQGAVAGLPRHALLEPQRAWPACFFFLQIFHITPYNPRVGPPDSSIYLLSTPHHHTNQQQHNPQAFDSAASFAGEVRDPGRTYPRAMLAALAIIVGTNWVVVCGWMWGWGWNWTLWNGADGHLPTHTPKPPSTTSRAVSYIFPILIGTLAATDVAYASWTDGTFTEVRCRLS